MDDKYLENVGLFKALADKSRLEIVDMLSCGELCACKILEKFSITQPTLSHHMSILCDCGLVAGRKDGKWTYYSLVPARVHEMKDFLAFITSDKEDCICKPTERGIIANEKSNKSAGRFDDTDDGGYVRRVEGSLGYRENEL